MRVFTQGRMPRGAPVAPPVRGDVTGARAPRHAFGTAHYAPHVSLQTHTACHAHGRYSEPTQPQEMSMKRIAAFAALAIVLGSVLTGCIVVPEGDYYHHRDYYYRY
ncbi:hypothetical protein [Burkholderia sp. MSMB1552]|uniref:hypothetical protein n=2 Tax=unclassified Burkholderia TaxID=2613784 RepID=UPI001E325F18|nr:hypothetical protein [Burkholderia sp. MSMB1552]